MEKYMYCLQCGEEREIEIKQELETYPVRKENIEVSAQVTYCKQCGEQIWNEELDDNNLKEAYKIYRFNHGLLQPEDIKRIREKYQLTQTTFAKILGFGEKTIARYETGSIQEAAQNKLMELADFPDVFDHLLKKSIGELTSSEYERANEALNRFKPCIIEGTKSISSSISYQKNPNKNRYNFENKYFGGLTYVNIG